MLSYLKSFVIAEKNDIRKMINRCETDDLKKLLYKMNYDCPYCRKKSVIFNIRAISHVGNIYIECYNCGQHNVL
jgi:transcription elongation factor Elf1